ncbi:MAG: hypothetical protein ACKV2T_10125 [Kofleriaceae bacterium]
MLRSVLMGVLALSAASACKGKSDAPTVQPGVAVGKVVEASGDVSATRGTDKRALAAGQDISGDDMIETGAGANVRIRFAHNNATWELGANKKQLVSESLAWKAPKADTPAGEVNEATLAAGRHAERETVTTGSTAPSEAPAAAAAPAPGAPVGGVPEAARVAMEDDLQAKGGEGGGEAGGEGGGGGEKKRAKSGGGGGRNEKQTRGGGATEAAAFGDGSEKNVVDKDDERPPPPPKLASKQATESAPLGALQRPKSPVTAPPPPNTETVKNDVAGDVRDAMTKHRLALVKCLTNTESAAKTLSIPIVVTAGKARFVFGVATKVTAGEKACLAGVAAKLSFPSDYNVKTSYELSY